MLRNETCVQPTTGKVVDLLHAALAEPRYQSLDVAVAYATSSGVRALGSGHEVNLGRLNVRWLSSFDWCRSDPVALTALDQPNRSAVRIYDGRAVIARERCLPRVPFHPKGFIFSGPDARLLISGSGNLSSNGLTRGVELDTLLEVREPVTSDELAAWASIESARTWFETTWRSADPYAALRDSYRRAYSSTSASPVPTDDDSSESDLIGSNRKYSAEDLIRIRRAEVFWIEAGNLTENLGRGNPGNQLMMRALTRVFFGFAGTDVPKQTAIGTIDVRYGGSITRGLSLEFAHNGMDRLNLPKPGAGGPVKYDRETLVLGKVAADGRLVYELRLASPTDRARLRRRSQSSAALFTMPGLGRQFGLCVT